MEGEVHPRSIPEMVVAGVRTAVEARILQVGVGGEGADTKVVSSGEVGIRASVGVGKGSAAAVVVVVADGIGYFGAGVAETHTWFVVVENTRSEGVKSRTVSWGDRSTLLTRRKGRVWVSVVVEVVEVVDGRMVKVVEAAECKFVKSAGGVELVEVAPHHIGSEYAQG